ncbi:Uu.00g037200.m01.CDS01 [Anthostomella pinea]|uniref:Uu.00g037200.m01.CDS01 n=1 Tax=Anthostomella pinea TaxID=933095 RepID=A0AAI8YDM4_9PEZI|nr:Uu.00g037200.m01.CDS01 [Anthostomella pinea]
MRTEAYGHPEPKCLLESRTLTSDRSRGLCEGAAFVGGSGSSKSTISSLTQRFHGPTSGYITRNQGAFSLMSLVQQESLLYTDSVRDNVGRTAIAHRLARALKRKPRLLLLDEATSAQDMQGEQVLQKTLNEAASGQTSVAFAHSIRRTDVIFLIEDGRVEEMGTHEEFRRPADRYLAMCLAQSLNQA